MSPSDGCINRRGKSTDAVDDLSHTLAAFMALGTVDFPLHAVDDLSHTLAAFMALGAVDFPLRALADFIAVFIAVDVRLQAFLKTLAAAFIVLDLFFA